MGSGLFGSIRLGLNTLGQLQTSISVINDNVSNVNTPGYSRKRITFKTQPPQVFPFGALSQGTDIERVEAFRNRFIEQRLLSEIQELGGLEGQAIALRQLESILFGSESGGISNGLTKFFDSFLALATDPSSPELRQQVLTFGQDVGEEFSNVNRQILGLRNDNRIQIEDSVNRVNQILENISAINLEVQPLFAQNLDGGSLQDQRQFLMGQLAQEIDFVSYEDDSGTQFISTVDGSLLLSGGKSFQLSMVSSTNSVGIELKGVDISDDFRGGSLSGFLDIENEGIPNLLGSLDLLASEFANEVNALHNTGVALDGSTTGLDLFSFDPLNPSSSLSVAISDPDLIAAGQSGTGPGDGTVAQQIADLRDEPIAALGNQSLARFYSSVVFGVGLDVQSLDAAIDNQNKIIEQLQNERDSVSGVSLDEEAVKLIQLQRAFQANTRFIQIANQLLEETMQLIG